MRMCNALAPFNDVFLPESIADEYNRGLQEWQTSYETVSSQEAAQNSLIETLKVHFSSLVLCSWRSDRVRSHVEHR